MGSTTIAAAGACVAVVLLQTYDLNATERHNLRNHVPVTVSSGRARLIGRLPMLASIDTVIGLPLRAQEELKRLLAEISDPTSPKYRHYLSPQQFTAMFGPTEEDYKAVIDFMTSSGLTVTGTTPNRMLVDVSGSVQDMERAFQTSIQLYQDPITNREFYAPDVEPSVPANIPVVEIMGLDNFDPPHADRKPRSLNQIQSPAAGSGPGGCFIGKDFRAAYAPGVTLDGSGQTVAVVSYVPYWPGSITAYEKATGLSNASVIPVLLDGMSPVPNPGLDDGETAGDAENVIAMAPGAQVLVYEGHTESHIYNRIATDNLARQITVSQGYTGRVSATMEQILMEYVAQGQTIFLASGDSGAYTPDQAVGEMADYPYATSVGGTLLTTSGPGGAWQSETAWSGSGGGVSLFYPIPSWQQNISMLANRGSTAMRNYPDVSIAGWAMFSVGRNGDAGCGAGTSGSAPLWAGFMALVNQQAVANAVPPVGFLNPALAALGNGTRYAADFHDITTGSNANAKSANLYPAVPGYDLVTGWGTPAGQGLIDDLTKPGTRGTPSFNLSVAPYSVPLIQGKSGATTITVNRFNGFTGGVNLTVTGLPSSVSTSFSAATATTSTLTLSAGNSAAPGSYTGTVTGTSGALTQTVAFTLTVIAPDFSISASPAVLNMTLGASGQSAINITAVGGFASTVNLSASGLPAGVQPSFSPATATTASILSLFAGNQAVPGPYSITITATSGSLSHTTTLGIVLANTSTPVPVPVDLSLAYGDIVISTDRTSYNGFYGPNGYSFSANLLGPFQTFGGVPFFFGTPNAWNAVAPAFGLTIPLPAGQFGSLQILASSINGNQLAQKFTVAYSDGTTDTFTQSFSDQPSPQNYSGETVAVTMPYFNRGAGSRFNSSAYLYGYSFRLRNTKTISSITVPKNANLRTLAMTLVPPALTGVSDYILATSTPSVSIAQGQSATSTITVNPLGGFSGTFTGAVTLSASGLPPGVTTSFSPVSTTKSSVLTLLASSTATPGPVTVTVTGTSGNLTHSMTITLTVIAVVPKTVIVDLSSVYNVNAIYTEGTTFASTGGLAIGDAFSATLLGPSLVVSGTVFAFGPPNVPNAVTSSTVPLLAGQFSRLDMLAVGFWGNQPSQVFTVTYTDGTRSSFTQGLSDCFVTSQPNYAGESVAAAMAYRVTSGGGRDMQPFYLYSYSFNLNAAKTVSSVTLPNNQHVAVLALTLIAGTPGAAPGTAAVVNAASFQPGIAPGAWITIFGTNLAGTTRPWNSQEIVNGTLPTQLDGVSVMIGGYSAAVWYVSPTQLNVQVPTEAAQGMPVSLLVTSPQGLASMTVTVRPVAPGLSSADGKYAASQHADYSLVGKVGLYAGSTPAKPGETILLYGTGFGPTTPAVPSGQLVSQSASMITPPSFRIGGQPATVSYAGIIAPGLYQFNVTIPAGLANGDALVVATDTGVTSQSGLYLTIQN